MGFIKRGVERGGNALQIQEPRPYCMCIPYTDQNIMIYLWKYTLLNLIQLYSKFGKYLEPQKEDTILQGQQQQNHLKKVIVV